MAAQPQIANPHDGDSPHRQDDLSPYSVGAVYKHYEVIYEDERHSVAGSLPKAIEYAETRAQRTGERVVVNLVKADGSRERKFDTRSGNPWPFSKRKPAECATKPSAMTLASAIKAARGAGAKMGDTGLFEQWVCSAGLATRSPTVKRRLEAEFVKGVEQGEDGKLGSGIHRTAEGQYYSDLEPESLFDTAAQARAFAGKWEKGRVNPGDSPLVRMHKLSVLNLQEKLGDIRFKISKAEQAGEPTSRLERQVDGLLTRIRRQYDIIASLRRRGNPHGGNGHRLTATIVPQRELDGGSYRILPITGPQGAIRIQGAFPSRAYAERVALETVRRAVAPLPGKYSLEFRAGNPGDGIEHSYELVEKFWSWATRAGEHYAKTARLREFDSPARRWIWVPLAEAKSEAAEHAREYPAKWLVLYELGPYDERGRKVAEWNKQPKPERTA